MTPLEDFLVRQLGEAAAAARPVAFRVPVGGAGAHPAILDRRNARLKLYGFTARDFADAGLPALIARSEGGPVTKVTVYARDGEEGDWPTHGFGVEGSILGFFSDGGDARLWARYLDAQRAVAPHDAEHDAIVAAARNRPQTVPALAHGYQCRAAAPEDAGVVAALLRATFPDYPTSLADDHVHRLIASAASRFRLVETASGLAVATASAEIDRANLSAEMTDCATLPEHRGRGLMAAILRDLERDVVRLDGIRDLYTLARADEVGMNFVFHGLGYAYTGRLRNNCRMPNGWESMNIWCRRARDGEEACA